MRNYSIPIGPEKCLYNDAMTESKRPMWETRQREVLREACRLSGARWAAWVRYRETGWEVALSAGLTLAQQKALNRLIAQRGTARWLAGGLGSGRTRSRRLSAEEAARLKAGRMTSFPLAGSQGVLVVGSQGLTRYGEGLWRLVSRLWAVEDDALSEEAAFAAQVLLESPQAYQGPKAVGRWLLQALTRLISADEGYVALREGGGLMVMAALGPLAREVGVHRTKRLPRQKVWRAARDALGLTPPRKEGEWVQVALRVSQRRGQVLGLVALGRREGKFSAAEVARLERLARPVTEVLDRLYTYRMLAHQLAQVTLLNEVTVLLARTPDLAQAVAHLTSYLRRVFRARQVLVLLAQGEVLVQPGRGASEAFPLEEGLWGEVYRRGEPRQTRLDGRPALAVPLRLRGRPIGVMGVVAASEAPYTERDRRLLQSLASHFALFWEAHRLGQDLAQQVHLLHRVQALAEDLVGLTAEQEIAARVAEAVAQDFACVLTGVLLTPEGGGEEAQVRAVAGPQAQALPVGGPLPAMPAPVAEALRREGRLIQHTEEDLQAASERPLAPQARSRVYVPLKGGEEGQPLGLLYLESKRPVLLTSDGQGLVLEALAELVSSVLLAARRYRQLQRYVEHLGAVWETALDLGANLEMEALLQRAVHRVKQLLRAKGAEIGLVDPEAGLVRIVASENPWRDYTGQCFPLGEGVAGEAAAQGEPFLVGDFNRWEKRASAPFAAPFRAVVSVPLRYEGETLGVITAYDDRPHFFGPEDVRVLQMLAQSMAVAVRNASLYRELEERMRRQQEAEQRLIQSSRLAAVGELAAGVAHELNNPLTSVVGFTELALEEMPPDAPWRQDLTVVLKEARRARDIVRSLLKMAHPDPGPRVPVQVHELLDEVLALLQHWMQSQGVQLVRAYAPGLPAVEVAPGEMKQVFQNLIYNAIQAMPLGGRLTLRTQLAPREGLPGVNIEIEDTGKGIPPEDLTRIFEPFFTTKAPGKGTGLGLAISYSIVQRHGGEISVTSQVGRGTCFTVWLPLASPVQEGSP